MDISNFTFYSFEEIHENGYSHLPKEKGVYIVVVPESFYIKFLDETTAIKEHEGKPMLYRPYDLMVKYNNSNKKILYIVKDGGKNGIRQRMQQFIRY